MEQDPYGNAKFIDMRHVPVSCAYYLVPIFLWLDVVCVMFSFSLQVSWTKLLS